MNWQVDGMLDLLNQLSKIDYENLDIDELLEQRECNPFDCEWMRVYQAIEALKVNQEVDDTTEIREKAFMIVYEQSGSDELAGYVSDDFGLIADSKSLHYSDKWLTKLIVCYQKNTIPCGEL